jgi:hypothetical protein
MFYSLYLDLWNSNEWMNETIDNYGLLPKYSIFVALSYERQL